MKSKSLAVIAGLLLTLSYASAVQGQRTRPTKSPTPQPTTEEKVTSSYDRFTDNTEIVVTILLSPKQNISLVLFDMGSGKRFVSTTVKMYFRNLGNDALRYPWLYLLVDGERIEVDFNRNENGLWTSLDMATLDKILKAKKVEGRLASLEFEISADQMKLLRQFRAMLVTEN